MPGDLYFKPIIGMKLGIENIRFKENLVADYQNGIPSFTPDTISSHFYGGARNYSKMSTTYLAGILGASVEIYRYVGFSFSMNIGGITGGRFRSRYEENDIQQDIIKKFKDNEFFALKKFRFGFTYSLYWRFLNVSFSHNATSLFKKETGIKVKMATFSFGINVFELIQFVAWVKRNRRHQ